MKIKYPRTYHLPWSEGSTNDDKTLGNAKCFENKFVVVTEKMDGENTTMYYDSIHARSLDSKHHPSRDWVKAFHAGLAYGMEGSAIKLGINPSDFRICGENVYAKHSIHYKELETYFYGFSVWGGEYCLSWDDTAKIFNELGITSTPLLYLGVFDEKIIKSLSDYREGYVVRLASEFHITDFAKSVAKFVRANHVQTDEHWAHKAVVPNQLRRK